MRGSSLVGSIRGNVLLGLFKKFEIGICFIICVLCINIFLSLLEDCFIE